VERAAYPWFGTKGYGVHVNGFVTTASKVSPDNNNVHDVFPSLWVARRSLTKQTWPGMLDCLAAGAQPQGLTPIANVLKECGEEASIPEVLAAQAAPSGAVSYTSLDEQGNLKRDVLFCFDLRLPHDFEPKPRDGEVDSFQLHDVDWCLDRIIKGAASGDAFKPNVNLVILDFLVRRGVISSDSPRYLELIGKLRRSGCS
jgi:hypothetical protein